MTSNQKKFLELCSKKIPPLQACQLAYPNIKQHKKLEEKSRQLLQKKEMQEQLKNIVNENGSSSLKQEQIADIQEILSFWTKVLRSEEEKTSDKMKASENILRLEKIFQSEDKDSEQAVKIIDDVPKK